MSQQRCHITSLYVTLETVAVPVPERGENLHFMTLAEAQKRLEDSPLRKLQEPPAETLITNLSTSERELENATSQPEH